MIGLATVLGVRLSAEQSAAAIVILALVVAAYFGIGLMAAALCCRSGRPGRSRRRSFCFPDSWAACTIRRRSFRRGFNPSGRRAPDVRVAGTASRCGETAFRQKPWLPMSRS